MQKKISFKNSKGQRLVGVLHIPQGQGPFPAVIVQHGLKGSHNSPLIKLIADDLEKNGFAILRFSLSGHKPSGGTYKDVLVSQFLNDIKLGLKFLKDQTKIKRCKIGIVGQSLGAFTSLLSATIHKNHIKTIVSISSFFDVEAVLRSYYRDGKIKESNEYYWEISGFKVTTRHFNDRNYLKKKYLIKNIHCPALIIHGDQDTRVQPKDAQTIFNLLNQPKRLKIIKGASHNFDNQKQAGQVAKVTTKWLKNYLIGEDSAERDG